MGRPKAFDEDAVLEKAVNLFWCRGYEATSVQDLVDGLGINRASLYDTYGDKHELYVKALEKYRNTEQSGLCRHLEQAKPALDLLRDLFATGIQNSLADPDYKGCFMVNSAIELAAHDQTIGRIVTDNQRVFAAHLEQVIERGRQEGTISQSHSAADLATFLFNTYTGIKVLARTQPEPAVLYAVMNVAMSTLLPN